MPTDKYHVDPTIENDQERRSGICFSVPEQTSVHTLTTSLKPRQHLTTNEDLEKQDGNLSEENQQIVYKRSPIAPLQTANRSLLSWRTDPISSFSDWTIQIIAAREDGTHYHRNYFCHSNVLAWGPRKGNFFVQLFEKQRRKSEALLSRIKMEEAEAKLFPVVLDFMYCGSTLPLSASSTALLYGLAETLDIQKLKEAMQLFVQNAMDVNQLIDFLNFVSERSIGTTIQRLVLLTESKLFCYLIKVPQDGCKVSPRILLRILQKRKQCIDVLKNRNPTKYTKKWENERSKVIGNIIVECCIHGVTSHSSSSSLTIKMLDKITNPGILPVIDGETSIKLLQVQGILIRMSERGSKHSQKIGSTGTTLSQLEKRCIFALVPEWRRMMRDNQPAVTMAVKNFTPAVLLELLLAVSKMYEASAPISAEAMPSAFFGRNNLEMGHMEADISAEMISPGSLYS